MSSVTRKRAGKVTAGKRPRDIGLAFSAQMPGGAAERASGSARRFTGSVATTGNSRGFRIEKAFFSAAPEFQTAGSAISVDLIGPGTILVRVDEPPPEEETGDPLIAAWLSFIEQDIRSKPEHLQVLSEATATDLEDLVKGVVVGDDEILPDDVTI